MKTQLRTPEIKKKEWSPAKEFLPIILGRDLDEDLKQEDLSKLELFEKGLESELRASDTIEQAVGKMVRMALAAEFGPSLVAARGARAMVDNIVNLIMCEPQLKKQALIIIDRFTNA